MKYANNQAKSYQSFQQSIIILEEFFDFIFLKQHIKNNHHSLQEPSAMVKTETEKRGHRTCE
ncbi:MAG: hypothetical protein HDT07_04605 [Bacteroidales bacterium]|nr:hypothetical protein [Bacteroidales bacterium]